jgi:hypothetical protein
MDDSSTFETGSRVHGSPLNAQVVFPLQLQLQFIYNMLWIEWENDVAHHKALDIVGKTECWLLGAETVTIKLGQPFDVASNLKILQNRSRVSL